MLEADLQKNKIMENLLEIAYEEFCRVAGSFWKPEIKRLLIKDIYDRLGDDRVSLQNMIYDRLGMSDDEIIDMLDAEDVLP